jgi:branched-chain amino acid transport system permease protein
LLLPAIGQSTPGVIQPLIYGGVGLVVATLAGRLTGLLQGLGSNRQRATVAFLAFILITFPLIDQIAQTNWTPTVIQILIFAMLALGLNIVVGYAGYWIWAMPPFAIGAYTTGFYPPTT